LHSRRTKGRFIVPVNQPALDQSNRTLTAADLGFQSAGVLSWSKTIAGHPVLFRILRGVEQLTAVEFMQRESLGLSDLDMLAGSALVSCVETGGDVIGAFLENSDGGLAGLCVGYGGYVNRRPRILSEILTVRPGMRAFGFGAELKKLQAAIALKRGFVEIVWTVDPLRAPNARLNIEKLGATCDEYEENRYGQAFGEGFYGNMPSDRLHMTWAITSPAVHDRLLGRVPPLTLADVEDLEHFSPNRADVERALVYLPSDIDELLANDANATLRWRLTLRETLPVAFVSGYAITGFVRDVDLEKGLSAYVITKRSRAPGS
jgi:predicted GNAT superfamily acetyltransferase